MLLSTLLPAYYALLLGLTPQAIDTYKVEALEGLEASHSVTNTMTREHTIHFNPKLAVQVKFHKACKDKPRFCIASPLDVLAHEILHVRFPHLDENAIIAKENALYKALTKEDGKPRPTRVGHYGKPVLVSCLTCVD